jgi:phosphohistidine phosphatase
MLKLMLLRHAKTEKNSETGLDFDRPLAPKGQRQAQSMSAHLSNVNLTETTVFCSDAKRTRETLDVIQHGNEINALTFDHALYLSSREELLTILSKQHGNSPILLIGHNDGLSDLASYLTDTYLHLNTCTLLTLDVHLDEWHALSAGTCTIAEVFRPV